MSNVASDLKDKLLKTISSLPESKQAEVLDFADFVKAKLEAQIATEEILADSETIVRLQEAEEDLKAGNIVEWKKVRENV